MYFYITRLSNKKPLSIFKQFFESLSSGNEEAARNGRSVCRIHRRNCLFYLIRVNISIVVIVYFISFRIYIFKSLVFYILLFIIYIISNIYIVYYIYIIIIRCYISWYFLQILFNLEYIFKSLIFFILLFIIYIISNI